MKSGSGRWSSLVGVLIALATGLGAAWLDRRAHWDDTGVTAGIVSLGALTAAALAPRRGLLVTFLAAFPVGFATLYAIRFFGAFLAFVPAGIGAGIGVAVRRSLERRPEAA